MMISIHISDPSQEPSGRHHDVPLPALGRDQRRGADLRGAAAGAKLGLGVAALSLLRGGRGYGGRMAVDIYLYIYIFNIQYIYIYMLYM